MKKTRQETPELTRAEVSKSQRALSNAALRSLRAYRLERFANRQLVAQRKSA